jgi:hypothetical protein
MVTNCWKCEWSPHPPKTSAIDTITCDTFTTQSQYINKLSRPDRCYKHTLVLIIINPQEIHTCSVTSVPGVADERWLSPRVLWHVELSCVRVYEYSAGEAVATVSVGKACYTDKYIPTRTSKFLVLVWVSCYCGTWYLRILVLDIDVILKCAVHFVDFKSTL